MQTNAAGIRLFSQNGVQNQALGLGMIAVSLLVVAVITLQVLDWQRSSATAMIRAQGLSLARLLSEVPPAQLTRQGTRNTLNILYQSQAETGLAYAMLANPEGQSLSSVTAPAVVTPEIPVPPVPSAWTGEREVTLNDGREVIEFYSPVLVGSDFYGSARVAFFKPGIEQGLLQLPFLASTALPVILLMSLFYFLMRRQLKPLEHTQQALVAQLEKEELESMTFDEEGKTNPFVSNFNEYSRRASEQISSLRSENHQMLASSKVLQYRINRIETMLEALPDAVMVFDDAQSVLYANRKCATLLSTEAETILNEPMPAWCRNDDLFRFLSRCANASSRVVPTQRINLQQGETERHLSLEAYPLMGANDDQNKGNLVLLRDCEREIRAEASREEFISHVAHELKTPLNTLTMYSEAMLGPDGEDAAFRAEGMNVIFDEAERMASLINNLLNITKMEQGSLSIDRKRVKFDEFVTDAYEAIRKSARDSGLTFNLSVPDDVVAVAIDKDLMRIALNNLLTNAVKYNRHGGQVDVTLEEQNDSVVVTVADTGIGINEKDQRHVFDKFYRADSGEVRERSGHGLGLALAYEIVQLHNGRISVASELNVGTQFRIELLKESELLKQA